MSALQNMANKRKAAAAVDDDCQILELNDVEPDDVVPAVKQQSSQRMTIADRLNTDPDFLQRMMEKAMADEMAPREGERTVAVAARQRSNTPTAAAAATQYVPNAVAGNSNIATEEEMAANRLDADDVKITVPQRASPIYTADMVLMPPPPAPPVRMYQARLGGRQSGGELRSVLRPSGQSGTALARPTDRTEGRCPRRLRPESHCDESLLSGNGATVHRAAASADRRDRRGLHAFDGTAQLTRFTAVLTCD